MEESDSTWKAGGAPVGVVTIGDPQLRRRAEPVTDFRQVADACGAMVDRLREIKGAGLAAKQVGLPWAIAVVEVRKTDFFPERPESPLYVMINPRIVEQSDDVIEDWEGCFSVPGLMGRVSRSRLIVVEYADPEGTEMRSHFEGYVARVIQHECDHLAGLEFVDRMTSMDSLTTVANYAHFHHPSAK